jgi:hypothetical protein
LSLERADAAVPWAANTINPRTRWVVCRDWASRACLSGGQTLLCLGELTPSTRGSDESHVDMGPVAFVLSKAGLCRASGDWDHHPEALHLR